MPKRKLFSESNEDRPDDFSNCVLALLRKNVRGGSKAVRDETCRAIAQTMTVAFVESVMDREITAHVKASTNVRTDNRKGYRNGYQVRRLKAQSLRGLRLSVPRDRDGDYKSRIVKMTMKPDQSGLESIYEQFTGGASAAKQVKQICKRGYRKIPAKSIPQIEEQMDLRLNNDARRNLRREVYQEMIFDTMRGKAKYDGKSSQCIAHVAVGIDKLDRCRLLAVEIEDSPSEGWSKVLKELKRRKMRKVKSIAAGKGASLSPALRRKFAELVAG